MGSSGLIRWLSIYLGVIGIPLGHRRKDFMELKVKFVLFVINSRGRVKAKVGMRKAKQVKHIVAIDLKPMKEAEEVREVILEK